MTDQTCCSNARVLVPDAKSHRLSGPLVGVPIEEVKEVTTWRRKCGCIRTSDKLKHILGSFPVPPPPSPMSPGFAYDKKCNHYVYPSGGVDKTYMQSMESMSGKKQCFHGVNSRSWQVVAELVQLVQLSVTATALALYYLIYCYMQLVYYTLRSALYFHNADGPMKITIGVVTVTSLVVGFNLMLRMERVLGILY